MARLINLQLDVNRKWAPLLQSLRLTTIDPRHSAP